MTPKEMLLLSMELTSQALSCCNLTNQKHIANIQHVHPIEGSDDFTQTKCLE